MGQLDNLPENSSNIEAQATEKLLYAMSQQLERIQHNRIAQLTQDIERLQTDKARLIQEINWLQAQRQQQTEQQQQQVNQMAQALVRSLQEQLMQQLQVKTNAASSSSSGEAIGANSQTVDYNENAHKLLSSFDATLRTAFKSLQQDLNSYQSSLGQQLSNMHSLQQQGEAILEALIERMSTKLEDGAVLEPPQPQAFNYTNGTSQSSQPPLAVEVILPEQADQLVNGNGSKTKIIDTHVAEPEIEQQIQPIESKLPPKEPTPVKSKPPVTPQSTAPKANFQAQIGFLLVTLSTIALSIHNVVVRILANGVVQNVDGQKVFTLAPATIVMPWGTTAWGGFIKLVLGNSLLILWLRMIIVVPLMAMVAMWLYPPVWRDIKRFFLTQDRSFIGSIFKAITSSVVGSGFFLFLSQVLIYIAIAQIGPGVAVTILFMYPIVTVPLAWVFFGDRPTSLRWAVMFTILIGIVVTALPSLVSTANVSLLGVGTAVVAGIAFALYLIVMQLGFKKLHPVPVSLVQFTTIFFLTSLSLMLPLPPELSAQVLPSKWDGLLTGGLLLGVLTLLGYLSNNIGVRNLGAARASIIASSGPVLTALLAFLIIPGSQSFLPIQIVGIALVTLGVTALSFEKMILQAKANKAAAAK